jgi:tol-pal system protein YbgF
MRRWALALAIAVAAGTPSLPAWAQGENLGYRLSVLEEQVRQLVGQIQELQHQLHQLEARGGGGGPDRSQSAFDAPQQRPQSLFPNNPPPAGQAPGGEPPPSQDLGSTSSFQSYDLQSYGHGQGQAGAEDPDAPQGQAPQGQAPQGQVERRPPPSAQGGGGNDMVELDGDEPRPQQRAPGPKVLGQVPAGAVNGAMPGGAPEPGAGEPPPGPGSDSVESAALDGNQMGGGGTGGSPEQVYEGAYNQYMNRQFGEAEAGFRLFLSRHRDHELAGNAQYWLGETYFVQGKYKDAARSFLADFQTYPKNPRAPNALLKLGMSLNKLGQKEQACGAFAEVPKKYPAAADARNQALREMKRAGC